MMTKYLNKYLALGSLCLTKEKHRESNREDEEEKYRCDNKENVTWIESDDQFSHFSSFSLCEATMDDAHNNLN